MAHLAEGCGEKSDRIRSVYMAGRRYLPLAGVILGKVRGTAALSRPGGESENPAGIASWRTRRMARRKSATYPICSALASRCYLAPALSGVLKAFCRGRVVLAVPAGNRKPRRDKVMAHLPYGLAQKGRVSDLFLCCVAAICAASLV